jgi:hypothetical protein
MCKGVTIHIFLSSSDKGVYAAIILYEANAGIISPPLVNKNLCFAGRDKETGHCDLIDTVKAMMNHGYLCQIPDYSGRK